MERGAFARLALDPNASPVTFDDFLADRQADARARILVERVQTLENDEYLVEILRVDADAVVAHAEVPLLGLLPGNRLRRADGGNLAIRRRFAHRADVDARLLRPAELDRIADEVLEKLRELRGVHNHGRHPVLGDLGGGLLDGQLEIVERGGE